MRHRRYHAMVLHKRGIDFVWMLLVETNLSQHSASDHCRANINTTCKRRIDVGPTVAHCSVVKGWFEGENSFNIWLATYIGKKITCLNFSLTQLIKSNSDFSFVLWWHYVNILMNKERYWYRQTDVPCILYTHLDIPERKRVIKYFDLWMTFNTHAFVKN